MKTWAFALNLWVTTGAGATDAAAAGARAPMFAASQGAEMGASNSANSGQCATGYTPVSGDCLGPGNVGSLWNVPNTEECADQCSGDSRCSSYEFSTTEQKCNLNTCTNYNENQPYLDYVLCVKQVRHQVCGRYTPATHHNLMTAVLRSHLNMKDITSVGNIRCMLNSLCVRGQITGEVQRRALRDGGARMRRTLASKQSTSASVLAMLQTLAIASSFGTRASQLVTAGATRCTKLWQPG